MTLQAASREWFVVRPSFTRVLSRLVAALPLLVAAFLTCACSAARVQEIPEEPLATDSTGTIESSWEDPAPVDSVDWTAAERATTSSPPVVPASSAPTALPGRTHTLRKGETLMGLARQYYGNASGWRTILEANRDKIQDPNKIYVGQVLVIPQ